MSYTCRSTVSQYGIRLPCLLTQHARCLSMELEVPNKGSRRGKGVEVLPKDSYGYSVGCLLRYGTQPQSTTLENEPLLNRPFYLWIDWIYSDLNVCLVFAG